MKKLKDNRGITLITLVITIVVMMILAIGVTMSTTTVIELKKYNAIKQDIISLSEAVKTYYLENESLPIYTDTTFNLDTYQVPSYDRNPNDSGNYYAINVSALPSGNSLNHGEGNKKQDFNSKDLYVVNEESLTVYYLDGAVLDGKKHYTIVDDFSGGSFATAYYSKVELPIISVVTMESNGKDKSLACTGDTVTLKMLTNYELTTKPTVKIDGETVNVTWNGKIGIASYKLPSTNDTSKYGKVVPLSISDYAADGRSGEEIIQVDFGKTVYRYAKTLPSTAETKPYYPSDDFSQVEGTDLSNGLVIEDPEENQYVWVEVPRTTTVYQTAGLDITNFTDEEYKKIENDLHTYTNTYRKVTDFTDTYYADTDNADDWFSNETEYNTAKKNMLKSVYENGGFYVGRYETGIAYDDQNGPRNFGTDNYTLHPATQTPVIKANAYPYNWVGRTQAKVLAENMYSGNRTSSLMFGVQWDLVLAFMHNKGGVADSTLTSDSTTIGNYNNNLWNITNASAKYSTDSGANWSACPKNKESSANVLLTTGADTSFRAMNIFDIAGNVWEWTLENTSSTRYRCAVRGGDYYKVGSNDPASSRNDGNTTFNVDDYGFRVSFY